MRLAWIYSVVFAALAVPGHAQKLGQGGGSEISVWRVVGAMALCISLAVGAAVALRYRLRPGGAFRAGLQRRLELVERLKLNPQADIVLIRCDGGEYLVAVSAHATHIHPLHMMHPAEAGSA